MKIGKCQIEVTNYCNFACCGCLRNTMKRPLGIITQQTFDDALWLCDELNVDQVWLHNWGEPMLHPHIIGLVRTAAKKFRVGFTTNGYYLNKSNMRHLVAAGLTYLDISVNTSTPKWFLPFVFEAYEIGNNLGIEISLRSVVFSPEEFIKVQDIVGDRRVKWQRGMVNNETVNRTSDCPMIDKLFIIYWDGTVVPCCQVADNEIVYTYVSNRNAAEYINKGIQKIHQGINMGSLLPHCKTCKEIEYNIPIIYKLTGDM